MDSLPLTGTRVLDLSRLLSGPYCTMLLADLGADVIKIEKPEHGDDMRELAPHTYRALNRNKRSMVLNLKQREGQRVFRRIAESADVIVESYAPGAAERLGVGYREIKDVNNAIIYCSITGYGQEGRYRNRPGQDINYLGIAGLLNNLKGLNKQTPRLPISHLSSALFAALSILAALMTRGRTGKGQYIDVAMADGLMSWMSICSCDFPSNGRQQVKRGRAEELSPPDAIFSTKEGKWMTVGVASDVIWRKLCKALQLDHLADEDSSTWQGRVKRKREVHKELQARFSQKTRDQWIKLLEQAGVPCGPIYSYSEAFEDVHVRDRKLFVTIPYRGAERLTLVRFPTRSSNYRPTIYFPPPELGEHTDDILTSMGFTDSDIERLRERGVFGIGSPE